MHDRVFTSTGAFRSRRLDEILDEAAASGVERVELSSGVAFEPDLLEIVRRRKSAFSFLVHNYFPAPERPFVLNLAALDREGLDRSKAHCRQAIDLCVEVGCDLYTVHGGFAAQLKPHELGRVLPRHDPSLRDSAWAAFVDTVGELTEHARSRGVRFVIENNVVAPFNLRDGLHPLLFADPGDAKLLADTIASPWLGFLVDVGHLKVSARTLGFSEDAFFDALGDRIYAFHLSDNDGTEDSNQPFFEDAWFIDRLRAYPDAIRIVEAYRLEPDMLARCLAVASSV